MKRGSRVFITVLMVPAVSALLFGCPKKITKTDATPQPKVSELVGVTRPAGCPHRRRPGREAAGGRADRRAAHGAAAGQPRRGHPDQGEPDDGVRRAGARGQGRFQADLLRIQQVEHPARVPAGARKHREVAGQDGTSSCSSKATATSAAPTSTTWPWASGGLSRCGATWSPSASPPTACTRSATARRSRRCPGATSPPGRRTGAPSSRFPRSRARARRHAPVEGSAFGMVGAPGGRCRLCGCACGAPGLRVGRPHRPPGRRESPDECPADGVEPAGAPGRRLRADSRVARGAEPSRAPPRGERPADQGRPRAGRPSARAHPGGV